MLRQFCPDLYLSSLITVDPDGTCRTARDLINSLESKKAATRFDGLRPNCFGSNPLN
jgi:hypothetical protein